MEPSDRLKAVCKIEKITQKELAESIGMSLRGFATVLGGKSKVSKPIALAVGVKWNYRPEWILSGLGDPRPKGHIGREIVNEENIGHAAWESLVSWIRFVSSWLESLNVWIKRRLPNERRRPVPCPGQKDA